MISGWRRISDPPLRNNDYEFRDFYNQWSDVKFQAITGGHNERSKSRSGYRRLSCAPFVPLVLVFTIAAINWLDLLHFRRPAFDDVEIARYMLSRWPTSWAEVKSASQKYSCDRYVGGLNCDSVSMTPMENDTCLVKFNFHNLIGFPYSEEKQITWSNTLQDLYSKDDWHLKIATDVGNAYRKWGQKMNNGNVTPDMSGIQDAIGSSNEMKDRPRISRVVLDPGRTKEMNGNNTHKNISLVVRFGDGVERRISLEDRPVSPP